MSNKRDVNERTLFARLTWGAKWGLRFGLTLVVYATVLYLIRGSASAEGKDPSLAGAAAIYLGGGFIAGIIVGALFPLTQWTIGAAAVGFVAALPVGILVRLATEGLGSWSQEDVVTALLFAALVGGPTGVIYRRIFAAPSTKEK